MKNDWDITKVLWQILNRTKLACEIDGRGRQGGFLCIKDSFGKTVLVAMLGEVSDSEKALKYMAFCQEKAQRLHLNVANGHISSWQSRNEQEEKYGGGIIDSKGRIFAFSGLSEHLDEALSLDIARQLDDSSLGRSRIEGIRGFSANPFIEYFLPGL